MSNFCSISRMSLILYNKSIYPLCAPIDGILAAPELAFYVIGLQSEPFIHAVSLFVFSASCLLRKKNNISAQNLLEAGSVN